MHASEDKLALKNISLIISVLHSKTLTHF